MLKINRPVTGWVLYDFANSAFATIILAVIFNRYFAEVIAGGPDGLTYNFLGGEYHIPGASMWGFLVAFSTAIVAISSPLMGAMADLAGRRKQMLVIYCYTGVAGTILLAIPGEGDIILATLIFIIANFGFAGGNVFYNAFLLDISRKDSYGRISGIAWGLGYLGGGLSLIICLVMLQKPELLRLPEQIFFYIKHNINNITELELAAELARIKSTPPFIFSVKHCFIVAGVWWGVFALPTMLWLKDPAPGRDNFIPLRLMVDSWHRLGRTLREVRKFKQLVKFLLAYLFFNDGIETIILMTSIFGAEVIGLDTGELILFFLMVQAMALVGSLFFGWLSDLIQRKTVLLITIVIWLGVIVWAFTLGWFISERVDFYLLGLFAGLVMGGTQATARSLQASFTPKEKSAEFFGFFAVSGRLASIFGPLIYGVAIMIAGGTQPGILVIGVFFVVGAIILMSVDEKAGIKAAEV